MAPGADWSCGCCGDLVRGDRDVCRQCGLERAGTPVRPAREPGPGHWRCPRCKSRNSHLTNARRCG
eukprot:9639197-Alexandrium_andersonii.AAC.1